ncbi:diguanylate cyclase domain-containing protein [Rosenbergiella nectarea]|uniref:diguanylate cyclase domain-containing protein n=1 Tax=Rosenbergiella nectarea TaxID=988801 RepID=UPI001BDAF2D3|nr:diguanylate cyclase [Rosenbergiella nectarea]MBT0730929.1 diguanylate cyclase [Rosenbergiella nectarea subsp. apis]
MLRLKRKSKSSIRKKIRKVSLLNSLLNLFACWVLLFSTAIYFIKDYEQRNMELLSTSLSSSLIAATVFDDSYNANRKFNALGQQQMFDSAVLYAKDGHVIARWEHSQQTSYFWKYLHSWLYPNRKKIEIFHDQQVVGWLFIVGNDSYLFNFILYSVLILTIGMVLIFIFSYVLSSIMYRKILVAMNQITTKINHVIHTKDFTKRLPDNSLKEFQNFSDNVNSLISEIERLNNDLVHENKTLAIKAYQDSLTGIDNRAAFINQLQFMLSENGPYPTFCILFMDGDKFKHINDTWGHAAGDKVLQEVANRLKKIVKEEDCVARLGGDEFAMIFSKIESQHQVEDFISVIHSQFEEPIEIATDHAIPFSLTIGFTIADKDEEVSDILLRADSHMYLNKKTERKISCD